MQGGHMGDRKEYSRSTMLIPERRELAVIGMAVFAAVVLLFIALSYQMIFIAHMVLTLFIFTSYIVLWSGGGKGESHVDEPKEWPMVSMLVPSYNNKDTIFDAIAACRAMEYPGRAEILVVDDGSTDGSLEMLQKTGGIRLLANPKNLGKATALNHGIKNARGGIIACIDSDTYPRRDALRKAVKHFNESPRIGAVVVFVRVHNPRTLLQRIQEIEYWLAFGFFFKTIASVDGLYVTPGPTAFYRKSVLDRLGGFDEQNLTEDMEIALRMQKEGWKIRACHETQVTTEVPSTLRKLFRQRLRWYRGGVMNILKYIDMFFNPKYGDFGLFVLPTTLGSGFFAALFMAWTMFFWSKNFVETLLPFLYNFSAALTLTSAGVVQAALTFQSAWILGLFSLAMWSYFLVKSFEISSTQPQRRHILPLVMLLWVYPIFIGFVFLVSYIHELFGMRYKW